MKLTVLSKPTILALIGVGKWGEKYLKSCQNLPGIKIGYVCSKSRETPKLDDLINKKDISGFVIATPTSTHFKIAKFLIRKNKNVLIEKPVTDSLDKTKLLYNLSRQHPKAIVMAGHIQLYDQGYQEIKKQLKKIGKILKLKYCCHFFILLRSPFRGLVPSKSLFYSSITF